MKILFSTKKRCQRTKSFELPAVKKLLHFSLYDLNLWKLEMSPCCFLNLFIMFGSIKSCLFSQKYMGNILNFKINSQTSVLCSWSYVNNQQLKFLFWKHLSNALIDLNLQLKIYAWNLPNKVCYEQTLIYLLSYKWNEVIS